MSAIANLSSAAAALHPVNLRLHGHKKGSHVQSTDGTGNGGAAHVPAELKQNLFGGLLNSLEQAIGVQATTPAGAATGTSSGATTGSATIGSATSGSAASGATDASTAGTGTPVSAANPVSATAQSSLTLMRNYLNNLLHNTRADGSAANLAGANLNVTA